jgi:hypothetical protein
LERLPADVPDEEIRRAPVSACADDQAGKRQPFIHPPGIDAGHPIPDIEALTKEARALLSTGEVIGWINGIQRALAYGMTAGVSDKAAVYATLGMTAIVQFCTAYASVAAGQASEKIFTAEPHSNVEADMRKIIMSIREVLAISSQATAAGSLAPETKIPLTGAMTAIYGFMLLIDGATELRQGYRNAKAASTNAGEEYRWHADKALFAKLAGVVTLLLLGGALMGGSFGKGKESQVHQWLFAIGAAIICADLTGGLSILADHFKQKNRELKYGKANKSPATMVYEKSMSVRSTLGLATQIVSLTAPHAAQHATVTKVIGGVTNGVAALSGIMRGYSYTGMARVHVRERGSGINSHPENVQKAVDSFNRTALGKATGPLKQWMAQRVKITGTNEARNVLPEGWGDAA